MLNICTNHLVMCDEQEERKKMNKIEAVMFGFLELDKRLAEQMEVIWEYLNTENFPINHTWHDDGRLHDRGKIGISWSIEGYLWVSVYTYQCIWVVIKIHGNNFMCMHIYNTIQYNTYIHAFLHMYIRIQSGRTKSYEEKNDPCSSDNIGMDTFPSEC